MHQCEQLLRDTIASSVSAEQLSHAPVATNPRQIERPREVLAIVELGRSWTDHKNKVAVVHTSQYHSTDKSLLGINVKCATELVKLSKIEKYVHVTLAIC